MTRILMTALALGLFAFTLVGCHAEGQIGDAATAVSVAR